MIDEFIDAIGEFAEGSKEVCQGCAVTGFA